MADASSGTMEALTPEQEAAINTEAMTKFKVLYQKTLKPLEERYAFAQFMDLEPLRDEELDAKPMVLLLGQYSTGKTSLVRRLVGGHFPGMRVGPEPTTNKFTAVLHTDGEDDTISGATLSMTPAQPFAGLRRFGPAFLNSFSGSLTDSDFLSRINIVDTPGVLSGATLRDYELQAVCRWFAVRADLILLLFDGNKLEVSDEFRKIIRDLWGHEEKVRLVLNKCDLLSSDDLMKVYGALMWAMGKCLKSTPEVPRIYTTAFGSDDDVDAALRGGSQLDGDEGGSGSDGEMATKTPRKDGNSDNDGFNRRMRQDMRDLMKEVTMCDGMTCTRRKLDDLVKRLRLLVVHMFILAELRNAMRSTWWWRRPAKKIELLDKFDKVLVTATAKFYLADGDLPAENAIQQRFADFGDWTKLPRPREKDFATLQKLLDSDIPDLQGLLSGQGVAALLEKQKQPTFMQYMDTLKPRRKTHWAIVLSLIAAIVAVVTALTAGSTGAIAYPLNPLGSVSGFHPISDIIVPAQNYASSTVVMAQQAMESTVSQLSEETSKLWSSVSGSRGMNASPPTATSTQPSSTKKKESKKAAPTRTESDIPDVPSGEL